jgi:hypothetical protein
MQKVNIKFLKEHWITGRISEILGNPNDPVIELCFNFLEGARYLEFGKLRTKLRGFLGRDTYGFCKELWELCLSAQSNSEGIPYRYLNTKKFGLPHSDVDRSMMDGTDSNRPTLTEKSLLDRRNPPWTPAEENILKSMRDAGNSWAEIVKVRLGSPKDLKLIWPW